MSAGPTKEKVLQAIRALGNQVTVPDVVAKTGLSLYEASETMTKIASETQARLQVTATGEIVYRFPPHFYYLYFARGIERFFSKAGRKLAAAGFFLFKISFGLILLFSVIFIFSIALLIRSVLAAYLGAGDGIPQMWSDFFRSFKKIAWGNENTAESAPVDGQHPEHPGQGFLLNCYSFLFGPGNPNQGIEDECGKLIAQVIRLNEGIVLAEHFSPYTGRAPEDETVIFQILAKFNGYPKVTENNEIVYIFPSMSTRSEVANYAHTPALIQEKEWQFWGLTKEARQPVLTLAAANLLGAMVFVLLIVCTGGTNSAHLKLFAFFACYGSLFVFIPLARWLILKEINKDIRQRNETAREYENRLGDPDQGLLVKLEEAENLRLRENTRGAKEIVYQTDKDYLEQLTDANQT
jgi:hypothetical protein